MPCLLLILGTAVFDNPAMSGDLPQSVVEPPAAGNKSPADDSRATLESIFQQWQGQQSDITSCRIAYRSFHNSTDGKKSLAEFEALIDGGVLDSTPEGMRKFITEMNGGPFRIDPPWGAGRIVMRDRQLRNDLGPFTSIEDREISVYFDSLNKQFDAEEPGASLHRGDSLATFRATPPEPWTTARWRVLDRQPEAIKLARTVADGTSASAILESRTFTVDPTTGVIIRVARNNAQGQIVSVARSLELTEHPGGITFPRIAVLATLQDDVVTVMHLCAIDTLHFNEPIDDDAFHLAGRAQSRIVDRRGGRKLVTSLPSDQADIADWLKNHVPARAPQAARTRPQDNSMRNALLAGNGLLLVVMGAILWRRRRPPPPREVT